MSLFSRTRYDQNGKRICARCGGDRFERVLREGFLQTHIMPFFHRYPWRCVLCHLTIYRPMRRNADDPAEWR
jgi:hypothetical protein